MKEYIYLFFNFNFCVPSNFWSFLFNVRHETKVSQNFRNRNYFENSISNFEKVHLPNITFYPNTNIKNKIQKIIFIIYDSKTDFYNVICAPSLCQMSATKITNMQRAMSELFHLQHLSISITHHLS